MDQVGDVIGAEKKPIESLPANMGADIQKYTDHIITLPEESLMILNAKKVLAYSQTDNKMLKESP